MNPIWTRREMLQRGLLAGGGLALPNTRLQHIKREGRAAKGMVPIIDTHQHLWDLSKFQLPWLPKDGPLAGSHTMQGYLREAEGLNIVGTVYMEVDVADAQKEAEAEYVIALCQRDDNSMLGATIGGHPGTEAFAAYVKRFAAHPQVRAVRQVLHGGTERGYCLKPEFVRDMRLLGKNGLRFDICLRAEELADAAQLADLCPDTTFILDHCGNANVQSGDRTQWRLDMALVAKRKNVACKISGIVASAKPGAWSAADLAPLVRHCAETFGHDRVIWASDWPVCTLTASLRQWVTAAQEIVHDWSEADRRKLFHDNAIHWYGLPR